MKRKFRVTLRVTSLYWSDKIFHRILLEFMEKWLEREHKYKTGFPYPEFSPPKLIRSSNSRDHWLSYTADKEYTSHLFFIKSVRYYEENI